MPTSAEVERDVRSIAHPLETPVDLDPIVDQARGARVVAIGEASHGTHEFYAWRSELTRRLVQELGFDWIAVEGDWPDCWRLDRWVRGLENPSADARAVLGTFERWPTWMWANTDTADFLDWLRERNRGADRSHQVGFYGLDVYSLWDSLHRVMGWLAANAPEVLPDADRAWRCFAPFDGDAQRYAWHTRLVPESCEREVVELLVQVRRAAATRSSEDFDIRQNAAVVVHAEQYYRTMVRADATSWNVRDRHMMDTVQRIASHHGEGSKGIVWAHNTHVGDARATSMREAGMLNLGQLLREHLGETETLLVGMGSHRGSVLAADGWGRPESELPVPEARPGSHEDLLHRTFGADRLLRFSERRTGDWERRLAPHRAIGVVYDPEREAANYVPTIMGARYDAFLWFETSSALSPLRPERTPTEPEFETEPSGY